MKELIDRGNLPDHIAVIMDGNGRWARQKGAARVFGHKNAIKAVREVTEGCAELGVKYLTLYAFSTENWARPKQEVDALMSLLVSTIKNEMSTLLENNIRLRAIGDLSQLPPGAQQELEEAKALTVQGSAMDLILALNYSGRWDLTQAISGIASDVKQGMILPGQISQEMISARLATSDTPDPELLIRTSGEMRISNFLLWQMAYTEMFFTEVLWPDFRKEHLYKAICAYQKRERRFGKISEQVNL